MGVGSGLGGLGGGGAGGLAEDAREGVRDLPVEGAGGVVLLGRRLPTPAPLALALAAGGILALHALPALLHHLQGRVGDKREEGTGKWGQTSSGAEGERFLRRAADVFLALSFLAHFCFVRRACAPSIARPTDASAALLQA